MEASKKDPRALRILPLPPVLPFSLLILRSEGQLLIDAAKTETVMAASLVRLGYSSVRRLEFRFGGLESGVKKLGRGV